MPKRLLHVALHRIARPPKAEVLEKLFDESEDWVQYAPGCWLLWTSLGAESWYNRLEHLLNEKDYLLIFQMELKEYSGLLPKFVWDWIKQHAAEKVSD